MPESLVKYFRLLYDQIHFPIQVINEEGRIIYVNHAFTFQWGFNISELNEYNIFKDNELENCGALDLLKKTFKEKTSHFSNNYSDSLLKNKEITTPFFRSKIFHVSLDSKNYVIIFHEDQTEMILTEEEIKKARDGNREAERLKDTFLNVLSHELRTPLNIILGYSSIIRESMKDKISPEDKIYLDSLYSGSERLFKSITQMLEFAQLEAGNYALLIDTVDITSVINSAIESIQKNADEKKLDIKTKFSDKSIFVNVDLQCAENAIDNLLENAVKYTKQGFIEVEATVVPDRDLAVCKIKDSGIGISSEYLDHLFQPFSQEDLNIGRNYEGNGLGLALAKRYIEKMGGSLLVDSIKGVGSTFTFTLPLSQNISKEKNEDEIKDSSSIKKIFMLEDLSESYELINAYLKKNYEIIVDNLESFKLDTLNSTDFDAIIMDVSPAHWNEGKEICKKIINADDKKRPIIIISSEFMDNKIKEFYMIGVTKFIPKPFSKDDLLKALE